MIFASSTFPQLFETLILVDPTIFPADVSRYLSTLQLVQGAITRKRFWPSKREAKAAFQRNKAFYGKWDPEALDRYVEFGLMEDPRAAVLKVDRMQEAHVFNDGDNYGSKRAFTRLAWLPRSLNVHIIRAAKGQSTIPDESYSSFYEVIKHATHIRLRNTGHLIAQEKPKYLADELVRYLEAIEESKRSLKAKL